MTGAHLAAGDALAAGKVHIIHAGDVHHRVAGVAQQQGGGHEGLGDGGQDQAAELSQKGVRPAAGRQPFQLQGKDDHQQQAHPEGGHGDGHQGGGAHHLVAQTVLVDAGKIAQGQADDQRDHRAHQGQRQGHRKAGGQKLGHRHLVGEGVAEVQSENLLQEQEVLGEQGLIQAQLLRQGGHSLLCGLLAQNQAGWLTGDEADDGKHQDGDHKQNRNHLKDPFEDVVESIQEVTPASVSSWDRASRSRGTAERLVHGEAAPSPWTERPAKRAGGWSRMLHPPRLGPRRPGEREGAAQLALVQYMAWYT